MANEQEAETTPAATEAKAKRKKKASKRRPRARAKTRDAPKEGVPTSGAAKFPRHSAIKALRIPRAVLEQNAGKPTSDREALKFAGLSFTGPPRVELSSSLKYGFLERIDTGTIGVTDLAKRILRPQTPTDFTDGMRQAVLRAPGVGDVYTHYRGENVPDDEFFRNALVDTFGLPRDKVDEFKAIFFDDLQEAELIAEIDGNAAVRRASSGRY